MHQPINSLDIPENQLQGLKSSGYYYCQDLDTHIPTWDVLTRAPRTKTVLELYQEELKIGPISTLIDGLDDALGGGVPIGKITELCGKSGTGKTQLCFQLSVAVQLPTWCGKVVYISTNQGFASHRIREIAQAVLKHYDLSNVEQSSKRQFEELTVEKIMENIFYIDLMDYLELIAVLPQLEQLIQNQLMVRLVIIDSISAPLKLLNGQERTNAIFNFFRELQRLSQEFSFAIVVTNDVTTRFKSRGMAYQTPSLGGSYYHRINLRVELDKKSSNVFKAVVVKNVLKEEKEIEFTLLC